MYMGSLQLSSVFGGRSIHSCPQVWVHQNFRENQKKLPLRNQFISFLFLLKLIFNLLFILMTLLGNFSVGLAKFNAFLISFYPEHTIFSDKFELIFCQRVCFLKFFFCFAEVLTNSHVHIGPLALLRLSSLNLRSLLRRSVGDRVLIKFVNCRRKLSQLWVM